MTHDRTLTRALQMSGLTDRHALSQQSHLTVPSKNCHLASLMPSGNSTPTRLTTRTNGRSSPHRWKHKMPRQRCPYHVHVHAVCCACPLKTHCIAPPTPSCNAPAHPSTPHSPAHAAFAMVVHTRLHLSGTRPKQDRNTAAVRWPSCSRPNRGQSTCAIAWRNMDGLAG